MRRGRLLRLFGSAVAVLFTSALLATLIFTDAGAVAANAFAHVPPAIILLYVLLSFASLFLRALRYELLLKLSLGSHHCPSRVHFVALTAVRNMFVDLLPARLGELSYFYVLERNGVRAHRSVSAFGVVFLFDVIVLFLALVLFLLMVVTGVIPSFVGMEPGRLSQPLSPLGGSSALVVSGVGSLVIVLSLSWVLWSLPRMMPRLAARLEQLEQQARLSGIRALAHWGSRFCRGSEHDLVRILTWRGVVPAVALTLGLRSIKYISLYYLFLGAAAAEAGYSFEISALAIVASFIVAEGVASLPVNGVFGFGSYEATLALCLTLSGLALPLASVVGICFFIHLITQVVGCSIGVAGIGLLLGLERWGWKFNRTPVRGDGAEAVSIPQSGA